MKLNKSILLLIILLTIVSIDLLTVKGLRDLIDTQRKFNQILMYSIFWSISAFVMIQVVYIFANPPQLRTAKEFSKIYLLYGFIAVFYLPKLFFIPMVLADDLVYLVYKLLDWLKIYSGYRRIFILHKTGIVIAGIIGIMLLFGMVWGRFNYKIYRRTIEYTNLPVAFDGIKILHLSDIHAGSFYQNNDKLERFFTIAMKEKPDIILLTGDYVNYFAEELDGLENAFYLLQAPLGVFAVLGNHDYGDYHTWRTAEEKTANFEKLKRKLRYLGCKLLCDETSILYKDSSSIAIVGVENWGPPPFQQYGDLSKALSHVPDNMFKILLSHDPRHWVLQVKDKQKIDLTLSGHTHGMQSGLQLGKYEWSFASVFYKYWGDLYRSNEQYLYISRGIGHIGLPMRIGMPADISIITLKNKKE